MVFVLRPIATIILCVARLMLSWLLFVVLPWYIYMLPTVMLIVLGLKAVDAALTVESI